MIEGENCLQELGEQPRPNPYVVSEDISLLLSRWAGERGFNLPNKNFFEQLRNRFKGVFGQVFSNFELVSESELTVGMNEIVRNTGLYPISLDRVYFRSNSALDITRMVDTDGQDRGLGRRIDSPTILEQFRKLQSTGIKEVVVVDDVVFSGDLIRRVGDGLIRMGIEAPIICVGIGITEGVNKLNSYGKDVRCVKQYPKVIDEICERDFYPGVPLCGRTLTGEKNLGVPYILPFGKPGRWASIPPEAEMPISRFCLEQTTELFQEIEEASKRYVRCCDLDRGVIGLPQDETRFLDALRLVK
jgi:hypothetical protein